MDGVAQILGVGGDARSQRLTIGVAVRRWRGILRRRAPWRWTGSSLTINSVEDASFGVNIIPHTQVVTTLGA